VRDVGLGGVYVVGYGFLRRGDACALELRLSASPKSPKLEVSGRVVRVEPGRGTAIEFTQMSLASFDHLDRLVATHAPDPPKADSELDTPSDSERPS
jgi:hypothetical protein